ncbi:glycosyltransferase [Buttiauxella gaviniae]|nr:glycosyltransferase [Buttiauxella gaviniae]
MKKTLIFTVPPIHPIPPHHAAAVEWWVYNVASRLNTPSEIVCIRQGEIQQEIVNSNCSIYRIKIGNAYKRVFQKWTRWDPLSYAWRIAQRIKKINGGQKNLIVHNSISLYIKISRYYPVQNMILHMHNIQDTTALNAPIKIITPSVFLAQWYQNRVPQAEVKIIPNGIDAELYSGHDRWTRNKLNLAENDTVILYAGRLSPEKGPLELMQAIDLLNTQRHPLKLVIIGDPRANNEGHRAEYQKQIREMAQKMGDKCILAGSVAPAEMHKVYSIANLTVVPSRFEEPFCMVALESMASAIPVLVSPRGGITEFVIEGETGFHLREPLSTESIAQDIITTLNQPMLEDIGQFASNKIIAEYDWQTVANKLARTLEDWV